MKRTLALLIVAMSSACVSFIGPHPLDLGRGAEPLKAGTMQAHASGWAAGSTFSSPVAAGGGAGLEGQLSDDLAIGFDFGTGVEGTSIKGSVMPAFGAGTFQWNCFSGNKNLALRGFGGMGEDFYLSVPGVSESPGLWAAAGAGVVSSTKLGPLDGYFSIDLAGKKFVGGPDNKLILQSKGSNLTNTMVQGTGTLGVKYNMGAFGVFLSGNAGGQVLLADEAGATQLTPGFFPVASGQVGITYAFDPPN
jgi:hypothetical protein